MVYLNNGINFNGITIIVSIKFYNNHTFNHKALSLPRLTTDHPLKRSNIIINYKVNVKGLKNKKKDRNYNVSIIVIIKLISSYKML